MYPLQGLNTELAVNQYFQSRKNLYISDYQRGLNALQAYKWLCCPRNLQESYDWDKLKCCWTHRHRLVLKEHFRKAHKDLVLDELTDHLKCLWNIFVDAARDQALFWTFLDNGCVTEAILKMVMNRAMPVHKAVRVARKMHETVGGGGEGGGGAPRLKFGLFDECHRINKPASASLSNFVVSIILHLKHRVDQFFESAWPDKVDFDNALRGGEGPR